MSASKPLSKSKHKLVGNWKIDEAADLKVYPWAAGLPLEAEFTITDDLKFEPGKGCKDAFEKGKQMGAPSQFLVRAFHEDVDDHSHATNDGESLKMRVESIGDVDFVWYKKGNQSRVMIKGPKIAAKSSADAAGGHLAVGIASLVLNHGGPHGIAN